MAIGRLLARGDPLTLRLPEGQNQTDRYDRLLRYVETADGVDFGMVQLESGNAIARYDSRDGYPKHPREDQYRAAQVATLGSDRSVITTSCAAPSGTTSDNAGSSSGTGAEGAGATAAPSEVNTGEGWWREYGSCSRLKKNTVGHPKGPFSFNNPDETAIYDWFAYGTGHNGDGDNDGLACE